MPVCDNTATPESENCRQRPYAPLLTVDRMTYSQMLYLGPRNPPGWAGNDWVASPVLAPLDLLRKCPKTVLLLQDKTCCVQNRFSLLRDSEKQKLMLIYKNSRNLRTFCTGRPCQTRQRNLDRVFRAILRDKGG